MKDSVRTVWIGDCGDWRSRARGDGRALRGRVARADLSCGRGGGGKRRPLPARGCLQGAQLTRDVPGSRMGGLEAAARGRRCQRASHRERDPERGADRAGAPLCRFRPDRQPEHAEHPAAQGARPLAYARPAQARASAARSTSGFTRPSTSSREGNEGVVLCERGIRTFETATRFTLDVAAVPIAKPGWGCRWSWTPRTRPGKRDWVESLTLAGVACGADGLLIETHPEPGEGALRRTAGRGARGVSGAHGEARRVALRSAARSTRRRA